MKLSKLRLHFPYIVAIVFLSFLLVYLYNNAEQYKQLFHLSAHWLLLFLALVIIFLLSKGLSNYLLYRGLGVPLTFNEGVGLAAVNTLANQLPFAGGMIAKGLYLKRRHKLPYRRFLSATLALYVCFTSVNGLIGMTIIVYWALIRGIPISMPLIVGFSVMAAGVLLLWIPIGNQSPPGGWGKGLLQLLNGWQVLSQNKALLIKLACLQAFMTWVVAGRFWIAFHIVSQEVTIAQCLLFSAATILTRLVSISPGGLGIREGLVAAVASMLGFHIGVSVVAVAIDRLVAILMVMCIGTAYSYMLGKQAAGG